VRTIEASDAQDVFNVIFELVKDGEAVKVQGPSRGVVVMSEEQYDERTKARRNAERLAMLERSMRQAENGEVINKTLDELKAMER
jgi:hypothetical protein